MKKDNKLKVTYRVNGQIRVPEVRIVGDNIESQVLSIGRARQMAEDMGVDLVEISPNAEPPVCRLIEFSKFIYLQKKHAKEVKAKQVKVEVKEIRFGPQTDDHDYEFKLKHAKGFLAEGPHPHHRDRHRSHLEHSRHDHRVHRAHLYHARVHPAPG